MCRANELRFTYFSDQISELLIYSGNEFLEVEEICHYSASNDEDGKPRTAYHQKAIIESPVPIFTSACEATALAIYKSHAEKGLTAMNQICVEVSNLGPDGLFNILQMRLDCVLLLQDLKNVHKLQYSALFPRNSSKY